MLKSNNNNSSNQQEIRAPIKKKRHRLEPLNQSKEISVNKVLLISDSSILEIE